MRSTSDVLVVGAGPTGLTAALEAHAHGASVRIIDRRSERFRPSRAMMLHARALECLRPLGLTGDLLSRADTSPEACLHLGSREVQVRLGNLDLPDTAFPHLTLIRQADVEDVLCSALLQRGVQVEWGVELRGLRSPTAVDGLVTSELQSRERGTQQHLSRFIAGCDGQASLMRGLVGATWRGAPYRVEAVLADVELTSNLGPGLLHVAVGSSGVAFLFALGEGATWRMLATRAARPSSRAAFGDLGPGVPPEELRRILGESGLPAAIENIRWSAQVPLQHRIASRFRRGPLFLAGDAAHAHSPAGGQGMNNGILDAANLGWKVGFASVGDPPPQLLDSFDRERRPAAREVLALTHLIFFGEASPHPAARLVRGRLLPWAAPVLPSLLQLRPLNAALVRLLTQPFVHYRHSAISQDCPSAGKHWPRAGDRLPDEPVVADGQPGRLHELTAAPGIHLLFERDCPQDAMAGLFQLAPFVHVHRLSSHPGSAVIGIRPDGYVGFRCGEPDPRHLADWLSLVGMPPRSLISGTGTRTYGTGTRA